jgi:hypothetical protein
MEIILKQIGMADFIDIFNNRRVRTCASNNTQLESFQRTVSKDDANQ